MVQNRRQLNNRVAWLLVDFLNEQPRSIDAELMAQVNPDHRLPEERIYQALLAGFCGLDIETSEEDRLIEDEYLRLAVHQLCADDFRKDPYYQQIHIPSAQIGGWQFTEEEYAPYEAFLCDDVLLLDDGREIPQIGFFTETFRFPVVKEKGREWMAIKPSEIASMHPALKAMHGQVVAFGLGLGYFAFCASILPQVQEVIVVERDAQVIQLFETYIHPQFPQPDKVKVVQQDALDYLSKILPNQHADCAFVDLWHDAQDGLPMYLKCKELAKRSPHTQFYYWAENTLRSAERWNNL